MKKQNIDVDFLTFFKLTEKDLSDLWELFMDYGLTKGADNHRSSGNHYFLQGICQYHSVEWNSWGKKLTPGLLDIIKTKYPQLMVQNRKFEIK